MEKNPYKAPQASLEVKTEEPVDVAVAKKIRNAWVAALVSASITVIFIAIAMGTGNAIAGIDAWAIGDVLFILGMAYGVYKKSRTCAILLFLYFIASKILIWSAAGNVNGAFIALIFMYFYGQGIAGTFQYHKLRREMA